MTRRTERELTFSATKKDFRVDWFSGQGGGGQHRNKHRNCCRITHLPSGLVATGQDHKERPRNQKDAFEKLSDMIIKHYGLDEPPTTGERSDETIRTYHEPRNTVKDKASGLEQEYKYVVNDGELADMIEARRRALMKQGE